MNEKYFKAIDSLVPPKSSVEKMMSAALEAEQSGKVTEMKATRKLKKFSAIGAVAASLALVIALGAFFYPGAINKSKSNVGSTATKEKGFFMTAYAAEATGDESKAEKITSNKFVEIGKIVPTLGYATENQMGGFFNYDIRCEGENIEKVTYKIDNSTFCIKNGYKPVIDKDGKNDYYKECTLGEEGEYDAYNSYTVNYNNQPDLSKYADEVLSPIQILGIVNRNNEQETQTKNSDNIKWSDYYNVIFDDTVITVTATFKDGSTQSQKLQLNCNASDESDISVEAKVIE